MAKARKEQFEDQLRDLQKDISSLSHKLAIPPTSINSHSYANRDASGVNDTLQDIQKSFNSGTSGSYAVPEKGEKLAQLMQEAHVAKREKDDAVYRLEQVKAENEEMRKSLQDAVRLKSDFERLKQDYESIRVSLESSERIRKQQKELINLLQRSHSIAVASDTGSVISFNSISTISHKGDGVDHSSSRRAADLSSASLAAENRAWLNKSIDFPSAPKVPTEIDVGGSSQKPSRRKSRSSAVAANTSAIGASSVGSSSRPSTADGLPPRAATPRSATSSSASGLVARSKSAGGTRVRRKKSTEREVPVHQYSPSFNESASSYSNIVGMNNSLVPNRHGEPLDANLRPHAHLSAYGIESASNYPVRQSIDSLSASLHSAAPLSSSNGLLNGSHLHAGLYTQQTSGYVPGTYVPGLGTPTLAAHLQQQEKGDAARAGRPPRHPTNGASPATTPTARVVHSVHVPVVRNDEHYVPTSAQHSFQHAPAASATPSSAGKRSTVKPKTKKISAPPTPSTFVRRIPTASPARGAPSPQLRRSPASAPLPSARHASPNVRGGTAPSASLSSTFGVSKRIL